MFQALSKYNYEEEMFFIQCPNDVFFSMLESFLFCKQDKTQGWQINMIKLVLSARYVGFRCDDHYVPWSNVWGPYQGRKAGEKKTCKWPLMAH